VPSVIRPTVPAEAALEQREIVKTRVVRGVLRERLTIFLRKTRRALKGRRRRTTLRGMSNTRSRGWCFTINYGDISEIEKFKNCDIAQLNELGSAEGTRYLVFGEECSESGTQHLQGYVEFANARTFASMKKLMIRAHLEARRGTPKEASVYCKKDGVFQEFGELPKQGKRSDLEAVAEQVRDGASLQEIAEEFPGMYVRYHRGFEAMRLKRMKHREDRPKVVWLWGGTGVGKTREAVNVSSYYMKDGTKWWDEYEQQTRIVIDDFDGKWPFRDFLRLIDRYRYQGQTKGGYVKINSPEIYITAEFSPEHFWEGTELKQVLRRITEVMHLPSTEVSNTEVSDTEVDGNTNVNLVEDVCNLAWQFAERIKDKGASPLETPQSWGLESAPLLGVLEGEISFHPTFVSLNSLSTRSESLENHLESETGEDSSTISGEPLTATRSRAVSAGGLVDLGQKPRLKGKAKRCVANHALATVTPSLAELIDTKIACGGS